MSSEFAKKVEKVENSGRGLAVGLALSCRRVSKKHGFCHTENAGTNLVRPPALQRHSLSGPMTSIAPYIVGGGFHIRPGTFPLPQAAAGEHSSPLQAGIYTTISFSAIPTPYPSAHSPRSVPARETHYSSDSFAPRSCTHCPVWNLHRRERLYAGHAQNRPLQSR